MDPVSDPMDVEEEVEEFSSSSPGDLVRSDYAVDDVDVMEDAPVDLVGPPPADARGFRLRGKKFFLTYPQCATTKETALERIRAKWPGDIKWCVVSSELHADGQPHLHVALWLVRNFESRASSCLDFIGGKHGNYRAMKKPVKCVEYVIKYGRYVFEGKAGWQPDVYIASGKSKKGTSFHVVASLVTSGISLRTIADRHPGFMLQHLSKVRTFEAFVRSAPCTTLLPLIPPLSDDSVQLLPGQCGTVYQWIHQAFYTPIGRALGQTQLMVVGGTAVGKTSLLQSLARYLRVYNVPNGEDFYDSYSDDDYDLLVFDEYEHQKSVTWMNSFVDGSVVTLRVKGGQVQKRRNLPVIMMTNFSPEQQYADVQMKSPVSFAAYCRRWTVVRLLEGEDLWPLVELFGNSQQHEAVVAVNP